jgi:peptidoglycan-associated lipoprotein
LADCRRDPADLGSRHGPNARAADPGDFRFRDQRLREEAATDRNPADASGGGAAAPAAPAAAAGARAAASGTVFFAYDRADLDDEARATLAANAEWMRRWTSTRITVEGHCDERGTAEYNIALGDRRAAAVRGYLVSLGIAGDRVTAVSKGKEAPVCGESTESCWRQNRRGAPIITAK